MHRTSTLVGLVPAVLLAASAQAQFSFINATDIKSSTTHSGGCIGVVDMNGDGLDDMVFLDQSRILRIDYQNPDGSYALVTYGAVDNSEEQWGMSVGDMDNDGHRDLLSGGFYDGVHHVRITALGESTMGTLPNSSMYMQCNNVADINNDGHNDFFACHDHAAPKQWLNDGNGNLLYDEDILDHSSDPPSDGSGNYGSVWTDFDNDGDLDLYVAKCRQGVNNPEDPRRWNRLYVNNGDGTYTERAADFGIQVKNQSWTADFGDIDNDGDMDLVITNHDATIQLFENDGAGHFTEITAGSGLQQTGFYLQSKFVDLDNDGFIDLIVSGGTHRVYRNNGNRTFSIVNNVFPAPKTMHSFATGDLNNDGFIDVLASYGDTYVSPNMNNPDRVWLNAGNDNNWFSVRLVGTVSNRDAIGARVTITGPWGTQIREVRSGESYGMVTSFACHFGLGTHDVVPSVTVRWPSGLVETFTDLTPNQTITVVEGVCVSPVAAISSSTPLIVCGDGHEITLTANDGYAYSWSTGETTQSITVSEPGNYAVTIDDGEGCSATTSVFVALAPDETPTVTVEGPTTFCEGGALVLTSSSASGYTWSNGTTGPTTTVTEAGSYTVTIDGACGQFQSAPVLVNVLDAPPAPQANGVTLPEPGSATLTATGDQVSWYDVPEGGSPLATGNVFETPVLTESTTYWVADELVHSTGEQSGAKEARSLTGQFHTNADNYQLFTAFEPFHIRSVRVYANSTGNRTFGLIDRANGSTVVTATIMVPNGESEVELNFFVPSAGDYALRIMSGNPQLWRDGLGSAQNYPYPLGTVGEMTSSSATGANATAYYYFFYDWKVEGLSTTCSSVRTPVDVFVGGEVGIDEMSADGVRIWPNPAMDVVNVVLSGRTSGRVIAELFDITGRRVAQVQAVGGRIQVPVAGLATGDYVLRLHHADGTSSHRVMVH